MLNWRYGKNPQEPNWINTCPVHFYQWTCARQLLHRYRQNYYSCSAFFQGTGLVVAHPIAKTSRHFQVTF